MRKRLTAAAAGFALVCAFSLGAATSAFAAVTADQIQPTDYYGASGQVDIFTVADGSEGDTLYVNVKKGSTYLAKRLVYTVGDNRQNSPATGGSVDVVTLDMEAVDAKATYTVEVFDSMEMATPIKTLTLKPVVAQLGESSSGSEAVALTGKEDGTVPTTQFVNGKDYVVKTDADGNPVRNADGAYVYAEQDGTEITGTITYVDAKTGAELGTQDIPGIRPGDKEGVTVRIPSVVTFGEKDYRTVTYSPVITAKAVNAGQTSFLVRCRELAEPGQKALGFYLATINLVDGKSKEVLATETIWVNKNYAYTVPKEFYQWASVKEIVGYRLSAEKNDAVHDGMIMLSPDVDDPSDRTIVLSYDRVPMDKEATWTLVKIDGSKDATAADREIGRETIKVTKAEGTKTFTAANETVDGKTLVPVRTEYTFVWGQSEPVTYVYYVPEGHAPEQPYTVTVNYMSIIDGKVLGTKEYSAVPDTREDLTIEPGPESLTVDGKKYLRVAGQDQPVCHNYYSPYASYTVYYRDPSDPRYSNIKVVRTRIIDVDDSEAEVDVGDHKRRIPNDNRGNNDGDGAPSIVVGATGDDSGPASTINSGRFAPLVSPDGYTTEQTIDDEDNPMAKDAGGKAGMSVAGIAGIAAALALAAAVVVLFWCKRRMDKAHDAGRVR